MRAPIAIVATLMLCGVSLAQPRGVQPRFDVLHNPELYKQDSPKSTLTSVIGAAGRDRYIYIIAHLLDPAFVNSRLSGTQAYFERIAAQQIAESATGRLLKGADLQARIQQVATTLNVRELSNQMRKKFVEEPDTLRDLKRFAREGEFMEAGDTATATLKDVKGQALYFKRVEGRWFMENRKKAPPAAKE